MLAAALVLGGQPAMAGAPVVVAALGDSLTHGYGLPPEQGFVAQLQAWLDAHAPVPVRLINAGVSGDTSAGGRARLDWTLSEPVDAVIVELGGNDMLRGIEPAETRANLDAILTRLGERGIAAILVGLPAPANFGPEWKAEFDAIFPELGAKHGVPVYPDFLAALGPRDDPGAIRKLMQPDGIHPNAEGVARIVADFGPHLLALIAAIAPGE
ncbi:MAG: arylesterase [Paracoccaceae bacterium]|nr:MAG: arylesterase [Paracoccaceae bacterium]